ncbi:hypothetical protein GGX14DRAFT_438252 [Mycena pura]|uniref:Brain protein I3 n=1 Tax=Mycena pura TaxID=153505 RepID=A0AAD6VNR7_9AGAR|nr:hypothetical protein GGX14DRAFT_438252 [Mycena pura]
MSNNPNDNAPSDSPPAYDDARTAPPTKDVKQPPMMNPTSYVPHAGPSLSPNPTVYHYHNPLTGEHVASLLPPDHPEMICLQAGEHVAQTTYGFLGILAAVFWFPLGVGLCLLDRRVKCARCGHMIEDGLCA